MSKLLWMCDKKIFFAIRNSLGSYKLNWNVSENLRPILMYRYLCMSLKCFMSKAFCSYFYIYCKHTYIYYLYKNIFTCISCSREMATTLRINHPSIHSFSHPTDQPTVWALRWSTFYIYCNLHKNVFLWGYNFDCLCYIAICVWVWSVLVRISILSLIRHVVHTPLI